MRVTILKADNAVNIDGMRRTVDCGDLPPDFHALQWSGEVGEIEHASIRFEGAWSRKPNEAISSLAPYQKYIDAWYAQGGPINAA